MKRVWSLVGWLVCTWLFLQPGLQAELIVRRSQDGRIIVSNTIDNNARSVRGSSSKLYNASRGQIRVPFQYKNHLTQLALRYGIRSDLVIAVAKAESSFNPYAVSRKGAVGVMQLMHGTAKQYGVYNRFNAQENMDAGVQHLRMLWDKYNGNIPLILAAYNAGEEAVKKYNGVPPYRETRQYVRRVMEYMGMAAYIPETSPQRTRIYKITTRDGRVLITDQLPRQPEGRVEVID